MIDSSIKLSPRCKEGHHRFNNRGICVRPNCSREKREPATITPITIVKDSAPKTDDKSTIKATAIAKLQGIDATNTDATDATDSTDATDATDGIHLADLLSPLVIEGEIVVGKLISKTILNREITEITDDDKTSPIESLKKWIKHRWPKITTTPFGEMAISQLLFIATMQLKSRPLPKKPDTQGSARTASHDTRPDRDTVQHADSQFRTTPPDLPYTPTPREL